MDRGRSDVAPDALTAAALLYLAIPNFVFLAGWLRFPYAVLGCALLAAGLLCALYRIRVAWTLPAPGLIAVVAAAGFAWAAFSGAGHLFYANRHDWGMRDALLADLVFTAWPPAYGGSEAEPVILRTALGYFLPAALSGKWLGPAAAHFALYVWTAVGTALFLLLLPLPRRSGGRLFLALAVVMLFSGMDILGQVAEKGWPKPAEHIEWWSAAFQYSSMSTQLFWAPNHALPAWLAGALLYRHWGRPEYEPASILVLALLPLWTPFAAIGIAPFAAVRFAQRIRETAFAWPDLVVLAASAASVYVVGRLLTLDVAAIPLGGQIGAGSSAAPFALQYAKFCALEFVILSLLVLARLQHSAALFWTAFATLALLPLVRFGPANDLVMRASIPALAILLILTLRVIEDMPPGQALRPASLLLGTVLLVGAVTPFNEWLRAAGLPAWQPSYAASLVELARRGSIPHYFGRLDRSDLRALLKPAAPVLPRR